MKTLVIIGAGGHGKVVADIARLNGYKHIVFLDDTQTGSCLEYPIVGKSDEIDKFVSTAEFFVAIGNATIREKFIVKLQNLGANIVTLIHPSSVISKSVDIGMGTVVMAGAVINPCVKIGQGVIINTSSSIDHDCLIADYCHISVGVRIAGTVSVGKATWAGIGASISNNVSICENCMIGAGSLVLKDITESGTYFGTPAIRFR